MLDLLDVAGVNRAVLLRALRTEFSDYEDAVSHEAALAADADVIVTRNLRDFSSAGLPVLSPDELLAALVSGQEQTP